MEMQRGKMRDSVNLLGHLLTRLERSALLNGGVEGCLTYEQSGSLGVAELQEMDK